MLTKQEKIERLEMAIAMLHDVDAMMQAALGASDECYELHNAIEDVADELQERIVGLDLQNA